MHDNEYLYNLHYDMVDSFIVKRHMTLFIKLSECLSSASFKSLSFKRLIILKVRCVTHTKKKNIISSSFRTNPVICNIRSLYLGILHGSSYLMENAHIFAYDYMYNISSLTDQCVFWLCIEQNALY